MEIIINRKNASVITIPNLHNQAGTRIEREFFPVGGTITNEYDS